MEKIIIWIDADAWLQTFECLDLFSMVAKKNKLAIVSQATRLESQNIQFKKGSMPILTFNFLLTFCVLLLLFFESASFLYFTAYYIFYGISINFYFRYKVL